jgi:tetratricopeptide (TPR) repeat protein
MELYTEIGDRRRIGTCEVNLAWMDSSAGDNESARLHCERAIALAREVGDRLNLAIAQNNLGDALRDMGRLDDAAAAYAEAVRAYHELDDRGPIMALFEDVAVLASRRGDPGRAFQLLGAADSLREALGSPRTDAAAEHLLAEVSASTAALGAEGSAGARERGRSLTLDQAVELTIGLVPTKR